MTRSTIPMAAATAVLCGCSSCGSSGAGVDAGYDESDPPDNVHAGCPYGFDEDHGTVFWVDPSAGSDEGDGSEGSPWASIQWVVDDRVDCTDQDGAAHHEDAPVKAGDTIKLVGASGHDPELDITGCYNADWVTIKASVLHEPVLRSIHFRGSAYWRIDGLTLRNEEGGTMVRAEDHGWQGPCHHVQIVNNAITSGELVTVEDYAERASTGVWLLHEPEHVTVRCNHFYKVGQAMSIFGSYIDVIDNTVEFFSRDGIATGGYHNRFLGNHIYDAVKLGDGHHDDFFQGHMGANPDTSTDIEIAYNVFVNRYPAELAPDMYGATQCLSAFEEGPKRNVRIYNNVCKTDHYHGIRWADTHDSLIVNNTVIGGTDLPGLPAGSEEWPDHTWISIDGENNVVRNNITTLDQTEGDHNLEITGEDVDAYFVDFPEDLSLLPTAPAVDAGNPDRAPADDVLGNPRDASPDVGAYEYVP
jgi:hypothetical protein